MKRLLAIIPILFFFLISCEKELDFKYHYVEPQLVIEGVLSTEGIKVSLTTTTPMDEKIEEDYLTDAEVYLADLTEAQEYELHPDINGIFKNNCIPVIGNEYQLRVLRNGNEYTSTCRMRPATKILNLMFQWIKMPYDHVAVLQITFADLESYEDYYWIKILRNGAPYKWIMSDDRSAANGVITEAIMTTRMDLSEEDEKDILRDGDEVTVAINTISREMYDYLVAIENNSNGPAMFEGDFCLGYFMASDYVSSSIIFRPDEITNYEFFMESD
ncbi:MAG: DUF4249 domain-containing protein [Muribaculaceae bacterium]|nr:DUF4249 domain-containing protein [Muribaculaceae bacterium]